MDAPEQHALAESAEDLYENAPCGYISTAPDGTIARVNGTFLRWTGHRREELVGRRRFQELLTAGGRIYHETHYSPLLRMQGTVREIALDVVAADGRRLPVLVNSVLQRDADGAPQLIRTTVFDATERRSYERELVAARDRERVARERIERLQRITTALAAAPDADAIAAVVTAELATVFGADGAGLELSDPETEDEEAPPRHGEGASIQLPLPPAASKEGRLRLSFAEPRELDPEERAFLLACAGQTALALERARLYEEARDVALALQRSLLAGAPPQDARFEVSSRYLPAIERLEVGGDWHDAFTIGGGRIGIVVGDVVGRGLAAASVMGQLRSAVRALAGAGFGPAHVLEHLDTFVDQNHAARYATLVYAEVDPDAGDVTCAAAGHMPPVVVEPDGTPSLFMDGRSPPLGVPPADGARPEARFALAPGAGFLLYTDGLVERRDEPIDAGIERLLGVIRASPDTSPAKLAEILPAALIEGDAVHDDVCLLSFRRL